MKWLLDKDGNIVMRNGKPVAIGSDGQEFEYDVADVNSKWVATMAEAKKHRKDKGELKATLEAIPQEIRDNVEGATAALQTVGTMDAKNKADVEVVRTELKASYDKALADQATISNGQIETLTGSLYKEKVSNKFATTKVLDGTIFNKTRDVAEAYFKGHFTVGEDGGFIGKDGKGNTLYSSEDPGTPASFDSALQTIFNAHPSKDDWTSATKQQGPGDRSKSGEFKQEKTSVSKIASGLAARKGQQ